MPKREITTHSSDETIALGRELAWNLKLPVLILLEGELGAGKTALTKGLVSGLGAAAEEDVTSPTFTLVHKYEDRALAYHIDLYRIGGRSDLNTLGLEDIFSEHAAVIIEWPDRLQMETDWPRVRIHLEHVGEDTRKITIEE